MNQLYAPLHINQSVSPCSLPTCSLIQKGYTVLHVDDVYSRAYVAPVKWDLPPPSFREVTADNLKFDLEDALKMRKRIMGCRNPEELVAKFRCGGDAKSWS